jgi:hypothetical protein
VIANENFKNSTKIPLLTITAAAPIDIGSALASISSEKSNRRDNSAKSAKSQATVKKAAAKLATANGVPDTLLEVDESIFSDIGSAVSTAMTVLVAAEEPTPTATEKDKKDAKKKTATNEPVEVKSKLYE